MRTRPENPTSLPVPCSETGCAPFPVVTSTFDPEIGSAPLRGSLFEKCLNPGARGTPCKCGYNVDVEDSGASYVTGWVGFFRHCPKARAQLEAIGRYREKLFRTGRLPGSAL